VRLVGIIPAAGYATRVQPLECSKEVYPVRGRPVMDYLLERMSLTGASEIRIVTRPEKHDVVQNARRHGATVIEGQPATLAGSIGLGLDGLAREDIALLGFPDTVWEPPDGYASLIEAVRSEEWVAALGLFPAPDPDTCDVVVTDETGRVASIEVKSPNPPSNVIWGCAAARAGELRGIEDVSDPGDHLGRLARERPVLGLRISDSFVDIGKNRHTLEAVT
jgi:glucose-1-phosphate thymidylyltransferase